MQPIIDHGVNNGGSNMQGIDGDGRVVRPPRAAEYRSGGRGRGREGKINVLNKKTDFLR